MDNHSKYMEKMKGAWPFLLKNRELFSVLKYLMLLFYTIHQVNLYAGKNMYPMLTYHSKLKETDFAMVRNL